MKKDNKLKSDGTLTMQQIRQNYMDLYLATDIAKSPSEDKENRQKLQSLSEEDKKTIEAIEKELESSKNKSGRNLRDVANNIMNQINGMEKYKRLSFEEALRLQALISTQRMQEISKVFGWFNYYIKNSRITISNVFVEAVKERIDEMSGEEDIEKWRNLQSAITADIERSSPNEMSTLKGNIARRIKKLQEKEAIKRAKAIPTSIEQIVSEIANGEVDIGKAQKTIQEEAKRRLESSPKSKFALSEEQQREQVLMQIKMALMEETETFPIRDPECTMKQLQELGCKGSQQTINVVITNLLGIKNFKEAQRICDKLFNRDERPESKAEEKRLRQKIKIAEISDMVLRVINSEGEMENDETCLATILDGLKRTNIDPSAICLGKSQNGLRKITLADVLGNNKIR